MDIYIIGVNQKQVTEGLTTYPNVIYIPEIFIPHFNSIKPIQIWRGSRFSAKSWTKAIYFLWKCSQQNHYFRGVFTRNTAKAARDSQFQLFLDLFKRYPIIGTQFKIHEQKLRITNIASGNYIQGGSFDDPEALMSVPDVTDIWIEEPITRKKSINEEDFDTLRGNLRNAEGVPVITHMTFNPIGKNNFIYKGMFDEKTKRYADIEINDLLVNYPDNPFCPQVNIDYLDNMKLRNPKRYLVDGLGLWGEPTNDDPFFTHYDDSVHYGKNQIPLRDDLETWISFDFNISPTTCTVFQVFPTFIAAMRCYQKRGGTRALCVEMKKDFELMNVSKLLWTITGDTSGTSRSTTAGDVTDYDIIQKEFGLLDSQIVNVYGRNKAHVYSRRLCDYFFWKIPFVMDIRCELLRNDLVKATTSKDGLNLYKNRESGYGMDFLDNFRYFVDAKFQHGTDDIDTFSKLLKIKRNEHSQQSI